MIGLAWFRSSACHDAVMKGVSIGLVESIATWDDSVVSSPVLAQSLGSSSSMKKEKIETVQPEQEETAPTTTGSSTRPPEERFKRDDEGSTNLSTPLVSPPRDDGADSHFNVSSVRDDDPDLELEEDETIVDLEARCGEFDATYGESGYLPAFAGDIFDHRYELVHELGSGQSSRVWLAKKVPATPSNSPSRNASSNQLRKSSSASRLSAHSSSDDGARHIPEFVAIKVFRCENALHESMDYEKRLGQYIQKRVEAKDNAVAASASGKGKSRPLAVSRYLDCLHVKGEHGVHSCLVFEVHGPQLDTLMQDYQYQGINDKKLLCSLLTSMLEGLALLDELNIVHTDIKPENMLLSQVSKHVEEIMEAASPVSKDNSPTRQRTTPTKRLGKDFPSSRNGSSSNLSAMGSSFVPTVKIVDFGLSYLVPVSQRPRVVSREEKELLHMANYTRGTVIQTREYRAPEIILGLEFNCRADVWSFGCVAFELLTGCFLFDPKDNEYADGDEELMDIEQLQQFAGLLGAPSPSTIANGVYTDKYYEKSGGRLKRTLVRPGRSEQTRPLASPHVGNKAAIEALVRSKEPTSSATDTKLFMQFLMECLHWEPNKRSSPAQLLKHPWLRRLASATPRHQQ